MNDESYIDTELSFDDTVEAVKARILTALDARSPGDVRLLVEEMETRMRECVAAVYKNRLDGKSDLFRNRTAPNPAIWDP